MNIDSIYLSALESRDSSKDSVVFATSAFIEAGITVYADEWICKSIKYFLNLDISCDVEKAQAIVSIGGDGTLLTSSKIAMLFNKPLLGINAGKLGFLTDFDLIELKENIQNLKKGKFILDKRMIIQVSIENEEPYIAVNDVVISRGGYAKLVSLNAFVEGDKIGTYIGDGLVIATPTGSTGYSLSAGGPIISPNVECIMITPICAHTLQLRPVVVSSDNEVSINLNYEEGQWIQLSIDGMMTKRIASSIEIKITKADKYLNLIRINNQKYFSLIRQKLSEWSS